MSYTRCFLVLFMAFTVLMGTVTLLRADDGKKGAPAASFITAAELMKAMEKDKNEYVVLDLRGGDYDSSTTRIRGARRIAPAELSAHINALPRDKTIVTYCSCLSDSGAVRAAETLRNNGFAKVLVLKGGWRGWQQANGPMENK